MRLNFHITLFCYHLFSFLSIHNYIDYTLCTLNLYIFPSINAAKAALFLKLAENDKENSNKINEGQRYPVVTTKNKAYL